MDELTAVRELLAEPPPPGPDVVTAARARLERATRGTGAPRWHAPRRPWRLAAAAAAASLARALPESGDPGAGYQRTQNNSICATR